jgi:hypothetical protein
VRSYRVGLTVLFKRGSHRFPIRGAGAASATGVGKMRLDLSKLKALNGKDWGDLYFVYAGDAMYLHWPKLLRVQPDLKPWLRMNITGRSQAGGSASEGAFFGRQLSFPRLLMYVAGLTSGAEHARAVGHDAIHGEPTTHYLLLVRPTKIGLTSPHDLRNQVWIDRTGRLRRISLDFGTITTDTGRKVAFSIDETFYAFGTPVRVRLPKASQVGPFSAVR